MSCKSRTTSSSSWSPAKFREHISNIDEIRKLTFIFSLTEIPFWELLIFLNQKDKKKKPNVKIKISLSSHRLFYRFLLIIYRAAEGWGLSYLALISSTVSNKYSFFCVHFHFSQILQRASKVSSLAHCSLPFPRDSWSLPCGGWAVRSGPSQSWAAPWCCCPGSGSPPGWESQWTTFTEKINSLGRRRNPKLLHL